MNLRSLLQDILSEVSFEIISFQVKLHVNFSGWEFRLSLNYRIFEDMHHGITLKKHFAVRIRYMGNLSIPAKSNFSKMSQL